MSRLNVAAIVEGQGEQNSAIRTLITRVWTELLEGEYVNVIRPIRQPRGKLVKRGGLLNAIDLAAMYLSALRSHDRSLILVLFDADQDPPCVLAPTLMEFIRAERSHLDIAVVLACPEFETWFAAAADSLTRYFDLTNAPLPSPDPERDGQRKGAVRQWMGGRYSESIDQVRLTSEMDLRLCRARSRSFDKLCRELAKRL